jgi:hypothetical protein
MVMDGKRLGEAIEELGSLKCLSLRLARSPAAASVAGWERPPTKDDQWAKYEPLFALVKSPNSAL